VCFDKKCSVSKTTKNDVFLWIQMCFDKDIEGYGCGIDIIDGALETLDMTLFKRGIRVINSRYPPPSETIRQKRRGGVSGGF